MASLIGKQAPEISGTAVREGLFEEVSNKTYEGKWLILFFYPMDFTFVCPTEILAFNKALPRFKELGVEVLGASTDSEFTHLAWSNVPRNEGGLGPDLKLPLLADKSHKVAKNYGVLLEDGVTLRGSFLIDPKGTLRQITINDLPVGRSVEESIRLVKAFQFTDVHGEVCPADWNPETNNSTINPGNKSEYFSKQQ